MSVKTIWISHWIFKEKGIELGTNLIGEQFHIKGNIKYVFQHFIWTLIVILLLNYKLIIYIKTLDSLDLRNLFVTGSGNILILGIHVISVTIYD